jgi:hypothetical protein
VGENHFRRGCHQLSGEAADTAGIDAGPAIVDAKIATLAPAALLEALAECRHAGLRLRIAFGGPDQRADPAHALAWLRPRHKRPHRCAPE